MNKCIVLCFCFLYFSNITAIECVENVGDMMMSPKNFFVNKAVQKFLGRFKKGLKNQFLPKDQGNQKVYFNVRLIKKRKNLLQKAYQQAFDKLEEHDRLDLISLITLPNQIEETKERIDYKQGRYNISLNTLSRITLGGNPHKVTEAETEDLKFSLDKMAHSLKVLSNNRFEMDYDYDVFLSSLPSKLTYRLVMMGPPKENELIIDYMLRIFSTQNKISVTDLTAEINLNLSWTLDREINEFLSLIHYMDGDAYLMLLSELEIYHPKILLELANKFD